MSKAMDKMKRAANDKMTQQTSKKMKQENHVKLMPRTDEKKDSKHYGNLIYIEKASASLTALVGVRSDEELRGCMIESYRYFSKVVKYCITNELRESSAIVRQLIQKFLMLCYSIKKDLPESSQEQNHPLSYEKLASIFLTQLIHVTLLSKDIVNLTRCSTISTHLFLVLDSSLLHILEAVISVKGKLFSKVAAVYIPVYKKIMDKCAEVEMNVDLYLRCIVLSKQFFKYLPDNLRHHVFACLRKIGTESISLPQLKKRLKSNWPVGTDVNNMSLSLLKKLPHHYPKSLVKQINKDAITSLGTTMATSTHSFAPLKENPSSLSGLFFVDKKADTDILRSFSLANHENEGRPKESEEDEQGEMDALIEDIDITIPEENVTTKRKRNNSKSKPQTDKMRKKKPGAVDSAEISNHTYPQDLANMESDEADEDSNIAVSESSLESEQCLEKKESDEKVERFEVDEDSDIAVSETSLENEQCLEKKESGEKVEKFEVDEDSDIAVSETSLESVQCLEKKEPDEKVTNSSDDDQEDLMKQVGRAVELADVDEDDAIFSDSSLQSEVTLENNLPGVKAAYLSNSSKLNTFKHMLEGDNLADEDSSFQSDDTLVNNQFSEKVAEFFIVDKKGTPKYVQEGDKAGKSLIPEGSIFKAASPTSKPVSPSKGVTTPKKSQIAKVNDAVVASPRKQEAAQNELMHKQEEDSLVMQNKQESAKVDKSPTRGNLFTSVVPSCVGESSGSDSDEEIVHKRRIHSNSYLVLSGSDEEKDSDDDADRPASLRDNSDADSEKSSIVSEALPRRKSCDNASPGNSDAEMEVADFFNEEADEDNRREEDMIGSDESDINDFLNDETSESGDAESSDEESLGEIGTGSPLKRKSGVNGYNSKKVVKEAKSRSPSPVKCVRTSTKRSTRLSALTQSSARSGRNKSSFLTRSPSPNPYVQLTDVSSLFEEDDDITATDEETDEQNENKTSKIASSDRKSLEGTVKLRKGGRARKSLQNSDDITPTNKSSNRKILEGTSNLRKGGRQRKSLQKPGEKYDDDNSPETKSPVRKSTAGQLKKSLQNSGSKTTPSRVTRRLLRNCNEVKTEPRKFGKAVEKDITETPVTKTTNVNRRRIAASAVVTRTGRKSRIGTEINDNEDKIITPQVRKLAKSVQVFKTSPRLLRSGYKLRSKML